MEAGAAFAAGPASSAANAANIVGFMISPLALVSLRGEVAETVGQCFCGQTRSCCRQVKSTRVSAPARSGCAAHATLICIARRGGRRAQTARRRTLLATADVRARIGAIPCVGQSAVQMAIATRDNVGVLHLSRARAEARRTAR